MSCENCAHKDAEIADLKGVVHERDQLNISVDWHAKQAIARDAVLAQCEGALKFYDDVLPLVAPSIDTLMAAHALDAFAGLKEKG